MNDFHSVYGLDADPFRLTPDPSFRFAHAAFAKAAEAVRRAAQGGEGIVMVTGKPGTGKTTLIEDFLAELDPAKVTRAVLTSTQLGADDLLRTIGHAFNLNPRDGDKASVAAAIEQFLRRQAEARRRTILVVDEAQNLSVDALEELRVLSTLHDGSRPLLEVLLVGQEQLLETLRLAELELLSQRIVEAVRLGTLDADETRSYIEHRLNHAGWQGRPRFTNDAHQLIHLLSRGLPRYINKLCARLLVHGSIEAKEALDAQDVLAVGREMRDELLMPAFADADLDIQAAIGELAELQDGLEEPADGAVQPDPAKIGDAVERPAKITTSIDRAYRPAAPEPGAADDGMVPSAAQSGPTTADAGGTSVAKRRPPRTATDRALVGAIVLLILAVGYGIWRHHPAFRKAIEPGTGMPVVTHPATPAAPVRAEGAVDREAPPPPHAPRPGTTRPGLPPEPAQPAPRAGQARATHAQPPANELATAAGAAAADAPQPTAARLRSAPPTPPAPATDTTARRDSAAVEPDRAPSPVEQETPPAAPTTTQTAGNGGLPASGTQNPLALSELDARAQAAFDDYRLTIPATDSAYYYYQLMLARAPQNTQALKGLRRIVDRYTWLAQRALDRQDYDRARNYVERGLAVNPQDSGLLELQRRLPAQRPAGQGGSTPPAAGAATNNSSHNPAGGTPVTQGPTDAAPPDSP